MTLSIRCSQLPFTLIVVLAATLILSGCGPKRTSTEAVTGQGDHAYVCVVAVDLSGSFQHQMADGGKAYEFLMTVLKRYFDSHSATGDKIIIAQLSGTQRSLLWEGTPRELRIEFPSAQSFRDFLLRKADPNGSMIHDGVRHAIDYVASDPLVASGKAQSAVFVLSDMLDNAPDSAGSQQRLVQSIAAYGRQGHVIGLYYVDQLQVAPWRQYLRDAGLSDYRVEPEFYGSPPLPVFDN